MKKNIVERIKRKPILYSFLAAANVLSGVSNYQRGNFMAERALEAGRNEGAAVVEGLLAPTLGSFNEYAIGADKIIPGYPETLGKKVFSAAAGESETYSVRRIATTIVATGMWGAGIASGHIGGYIGARKAISDHKNTL